MIPRLKRQGGQYVEDVQSRLGPFRAGLGALGELGRGVARGIAGLGAPGSQASEIFGPIGYGPDYMHPRQRRRENEIADLFAGDPESLRWARVSPELALTRAQNQETTSAANAFTTERDRTLHGYNIAQLREQARLAEAGKRSQLTNEPQDVYIDGEPRQVVRGPEGWADFYTGEALDPSTFSLREPAEDAMTAAEASDYLEDRGRRAEATLSSIERALELSTPMTTGVGGRWGRRAQLAGLWWGQKAANLGQAIQSIDAAMAFDELQYMRDNSKTGGALGQVSNMEINLLKSRIASLDPDLQDEAQFEENLMKVMEQVVASADAIRRAYMRDHPGEPVPNLQLFQLADRIREQFAEELASRGGGDVPPMTEAARAAGVTDEEWRHLTPAEREQLYADEGAAQTRPQFNLGFGPSAPGAY